MYSGNEYVERGEFGDVGNWAEDDEGGIMYADEDGGGFMDMGKVEQDEVSKTNMMLLENEFRLYQEQYDYEDVLDEKKRKKAEDDRPRYFSDGYEANVDPADEVELARWQSQFPYLQVVGIGYQDPPEDTNVSRKGYKEEDDEDMPFVEIPHNSDVGNLVVTGKKLSILPCKVIEISDDGDIVEEVIEQDGILEEVIEIDCRPVEDTERPHSPATVIKDEITSELIDIVWPDMVYSLAPFVRKILQLADEQGVTTDVEELQRINTKVATVKQNDFFDDW